MRRVAGFQDICEETDGFVDCYTSTDCEEVEKFLREIGFSVAEGRNSLFMESYGVAGRVRKKDITVELVDIPLDEALKYGKDFGFNAMSKCRIYLNRSLKNNSAIVREIFMKLHEERQNAAMLNSDYSRVYARYF